MAFSTEFILGAGGGSGIDLNMSALAHTLNSTPTTLGEPYIVDKAGVYSVAVFGNLTDAPTSGNASLELLVNGVVVEAGAALSNTATVVSCFLVRYLAAGDTITMRGSASGIVRTVLYEPTIAVAPIDTVGDGTAHTGGPIELVRNQWTALASYTAARSGVVLVDYGVGFASTVSMQSRIAVNGQARIGNPIRAVNERWHRALSVNAGDVVEAQAYTSSYTASQRIVNSWTISFH